MFKSKYTLINVQRRTVCGLSFGNDYWKMMETSAAEAAKRPTSWEGQSAISRDHFSCDTLILPWNCRKSRCAFLPTNEQTLHIHVLLCAGLCGWRCWFRGCEVDFGVKGFCTGTVMKAARSSPSKLYIKCVLFAAFPFCQTLFSKLRKR